MAVVRDARVKQSMEAVHVFSKLVALARYHDQMVSIAGKMQATSNVGLDLDRFMRGSKRVQVDSPDEEFKCWFNDDFAGAAVLLSSQSVIAGGRDFVKDLQK